LLAASCLWLRQRGALTPSRAAALLRLERLAEQPNCSASDGPDGPEDCSRTQCCRHPGFQCYAKNDYFAMCMASCNPGRNPTDPGQDTWTCKELGKRTPGKVPTCSDVWSNCAESKCCQDAGALCYGKNATWASCKVACQPGLDPNDADGGSWSCEQLGPRAPERAPWVEGSCTRQGEDCSYSRCCLGSGMKCYEKNPYWAACRAKCKPGQIDLTEPEEYRTNWTCNELGGAMVNTVAETKRKISLTEPLAVPRCSGDGEDCMESRCCSEPDQLCFGRNDTSALCSTASECEGTCDALPRLSSLFCFAVFRVKTYEMGLIELQLDRGIGIFACDETMLLADAKMSLGTIRKHGKDVEVRTHTFKQMPVGLSQDGSAANTALFMKVWDVVLEFEAYKRHAWTIKVDPDAVLLPDRARQHVLKYAGQNVYVVNCNKYPDSNNFPMMYGPVEMFSKEAIETYRELGWHCASELDWSMWGEDYYLTHCMDHIHVTRVNDFELVGDNSCTGAVCSDSMSAAFHPFKDVKTWVDCLDDALQTKRPIKYKYVDAISVQKANSMGNNSTDAVDDNMDLDGIDADAGEGWCCSFATDPDDQCGTCQGKFDDDNWCATSQTECEACQKSWCHDSDTETTTKKKRKAKTSTPTPKTTTAAPEATTTTATPSASSPPPKPPPVNVDGDDASDLAKEVVNKYEKFRSLGPQHAEQHDVKSLDSADGVRG